MRNMNRASEGLVILLDELNDVIATEREKVRKHAIDNDSTFLEVLNSDLYKKSEQKIERAEDLKTEILRIHGKILNLA